MWESRKSRNDEDGLKTLNISQCTALTPSAVQAVCDSFPALHTCSGRHSLIMSGCLNLTSVHCACAVQAHRTPAAFAHSAHWIERIGANTEFAWRDETQPQYICLCWDVKDWLQMGSSHLFEPTDFEKYLKLVWDFNYVQPALLQRQIWFPHLCWFSHSFAG